MLDCYQLEPLQVFFSLSARTVARSGLRVSGKRYFAQTPYTLHSSSSAPSLPRVGLCES